MASIVKELDKVTGTTTRSHNIADAVSKLKMGGGSGVGGSGKINLIVDDVEQDGEHVSVFSIDKSFAEIHELYLSGISPYICTTQGYVYALSTIDSESITFWRGLNIFTESDENDNDYLVLSKEGFIVLSDNTVQPKSREYNVVLRPADPEA